MISMQKMVSHVVFIINFVSREPLRVYNLFSFSCTSAEHLSPLLEQISKLEEALYNIQFEQHWLEAQTEQQAIGK